MTAADRLDQIESRLNHTSYHRHKDDVYALVAALRAGLEWADAWEASPAVGYNSAEQWEFDTLRDAGKELRAAIEEALA